MVMVFAAGVVMSSRICARQGHGLVHDRMVSVAGATFEHDLTVIVPTYNESGNVAELVRRTARALSGMNAAILFVDDSTDDTADVVREVAKTASIPVSVIHRAEPVNG